MLNSVSSSPSSLPLDRDARRLALRQQLLALLEATAERMADDLIDLPEDQLFGPIEYRLRDHARRLAAEAHQCALDGRKKGATKEPRPSAPTAATTPASSATCRAMS